jgi:hypothetical protein
VDGGSSQAYRKDLSNMNVYVVYHYMDRDGGVSAIFDTERKALDFVIKEYYSAPYFQNMNSTWLDDNSSEYVVEMKVF